MKTASSKRHNLERMAEKKFVQEVLSRKVTPEVEAFTAAAVQRSHQARSAAFLSRFRCTDLTGLATA